MQKTYTAPITTKNFPEAWEYMDHKRRYTKRRYAVCRAAGTVSNLFFTFWVLFLGNGLLGHRLGGIYSVFLHSIPGFTEVWQFFTAHILASAEALWLQILLTCAAAFVPPLALAAVLSALIYALHHPRAVPADTSDDAGTRLVETVKKARSYALYTASGTSLLCGTLFLIGMGIIVSGFIFHVGSDYFASAPNLMPIIMSSAMGLLILFSLLDQLFVMLCWPLYRCKIPYALVAEAEYYQYVGSKETADLPADELRQSCRTAAAKLREQGVMLEIRKDRASANLCFLEGSHLGDPLCMENYARHCILTHKREAALYWLDRCIASGEAHPRVHRQRRALKWRRPVKVRYL